MPSAIAVLGYGLALVLGLLAALHVYWALGGQWGISAALGGRDAPPSGAIWAVAIALSLAVLVVLGRIGAWDAGLPLWMFGYGTWALAVVLALAALVNFAGRTTLERLGIAPFCLLLAALVAVVAGSRTF